MRRRARRGRAAGSRARLRARPIVRPAGHGEGRPRAVLRAGRCAALTQVRGSAGAPRERSKLPLAGFVLAARFLLETKQRRGRGEGGCGGGGGGRAVPTERRPGAPRRAGNAAPGAPRSPAWLPEGLEGSEPAPGVAAHSPGLSAVGAAGTPGLAPTPLCSPARRPAQGFKRGFIYLYPL